MNELVGLAGYFGGMLAVAVTIIFWPRAWQRTWDWCHDRMESLLRLLRII